MPGIPTHFKILELTIDKLNKSPEPNLREIGELMQANLPYAYLGAIGTSLADFMPRGFFPFEANHYMSIWNIIFRIVGGTGDNFPGLNAILKEMYKFLDKIEPIAKSEDLDKLKAMQHEADIINQVARQLSDLVVVVKNDLIFQIKKLIETDTMPPVMQTALGEPPKPPQEWTAREFLRWKKSGAFVVALMNEAVTNKNPQLFAYAYGYITHYAGNVCGNPFINSIVGGPYRTQWWRHRWISNFVDSWVHGYYETKASMVGDSPTPPYKEWSSLCNARLHEKIQLGELDPIDIMTKVGNGQDFPVILSNEFTKSWMSAFKHAFNNEQHPAINEKTLNDAYYLTWLVLWFQTSGEGLGCVDNFPKYSEYCGECSWCDPANPGDNGSGSGPPPPTIEKEMDWTQLIIGILIAILGLITFCAGGGIAGAAAISGGIVISKNSGDVNWEKLRCDLYWYRLYVYNGLKAIYDLGSLGGFLFPLTNVLDQDTQKILLSGIEFTYDSGTKVVRSSVSTRMYPSKLWEPTIVPNWIVKPPFYEGSLENPNLESYNIQAYPSFFVSDSTANPLSNGQIRIGGIWPFKKSSGTDRPEQPGNAVDNSVDIIKNMGDLPNWNLDADRGLSFLTWIFNPNTSPKDDPVTIQPES